MKLLDKIKKFIGIESPSKVWKEEADKKYTLFWYRYDGDQTYNLKRDYEFYQ